LEERYKGQKDDDADINIKWMTLKKREDNGT
jgi:hypothetical protein